MDPVLVGVDVQVRRGVAVAVMDTGARAFEVFPTATYAALDGAPGGGEVTLPLAAMRPGPKDMLDAAAAAYTLVRLHRGEGAEVGGGDGLGAIVLPVRPRPHPVLDWPA